MATRHLGQFLSTTGKAPAANTESEYFMTGNYASDTAFYIEAPADKKYEISELRVIIEDGDPVTQNSYAADISLSGTNGILIQAIQGGVTTDLTSGQRIQKFFGWERISSGGPETFGGDYQKAVINFEEAFGGPLILAPGDKFQLILKGDFTGLATSGSHTAYVSGQQTDVEALQTSATSSRSVAIDSLGNTTLISGERITVTGSATANVEIANQVMNRKTILDFSGATITGYNIQVDNCENLVLYKPNIDMQAVSSNGIKVAGSKKIFMVYPKVKNGSNGIKLTEGTARSFVYKGESHGASTDGMSCHEANGNECGNKNVFYHCNSSGTEQGFDITSGEKHSIIGGRGYGGTFSTAVGHNASVYIVDLKTPGYGLSIKQCKFAHVTDIDVSQLRLEKQGSNDQPPANVKFYGKPEPSINNPDSLTLSDIYEVKSSNFVHPYQSWIDNTVEWIEENF